MPPNELPGAGWSRRPHLRARIAVPLTGARVKRQPSMTDAEYGEFSDAVGSLEVSLAKAAAKRKRSRYVRSRPRRDTEKVKQADYDRWVASKSIRPTASDEAEWEENWDRLSLLDASLRPSARKRQWLATSRRRPRLRKPVPPPGVVEQKPIRVRLPDPPAWGIRREWEADGGTCGIDWSRVPGMVTEIACPVVQPGCTPRRSCGSRGHVHSWKIRRIKIFVRDGWKCLRCGFTDQTGRRLHADHVVPISPRWGGQERCMANLQTLCQRCNLRKGDRDCSDYRDLERIAWGLSRCDCGRE